MIRSTSGLWPALSAALLGATLSGCGGNAASDNASAPASTDTSASAAPSSAAPPAAPSAASANAAGNVSGAGGASTSTAGAASFKEASAQWKQVMAARAGLDSTVKAKQLSKVHEAAFKVRDLVRALPAKSSGLSPDKQKTLATQVKNIDQLASLLDKAGDSGKLKDVQDNQAGLGDALDIIKGLYPSGALS